MLITEWFSSPDRGSTEFTLITIALLGPKEDGLRFGILAFVEIKPIFLQLCIK
jgi:hypothetical protein